MRERSFSPSGHTSGDEPRETLSLPLCAGEVIAGKYRIDRVLGRGGMGVVVAAYHLELEKLFALKLLRPEALPSQQARRRFLAEARASARLASPHAARVHDVGCLDSGAPFMVMEHLEGANLRDVLAARGPLPFEDAARYVLQACDAIAAAHARGIIHRDIKPSNLFLAEQPSAPALIKVIDFGVSKLPAEEGGGDWTGDGALLGTPLYMSPEQLASSKRVDARSDIWSLGVVLYELFTGKPPFGAGSPAEMRARIALGPPERPAAIRPSIPPELDAIVLRCLAIAPEDRFQSVPELIAALENALASQRGRPAPRPRARFALLATLVTAAGAFITLSAASGKDMSRAPLQRIAPSLPAPAPCPPPVPEGMVLVPARGPDTSAFHLDRTEVTAGEYARCIAAGACTPARVHGRKVDAAQAQKFGKYCTGQSPSRATHPINCVDQRQAAAYCAFAGKRLPSAQEWEHAARGNDERAYPWGNDAPTCEKGNFTCEAGPSGLGRPRGTLPVGSFPRAPSPFGALDMAGNVWEWVAEEGMLRGGSWDFSSASATTTSHIEFDPASGHVSTGFRCAKTTR